MRQKRSLEKMNRSEFGKLLYEDFLDREPKVTYKQIAEKGEVRGVDATVISRMVVSGIFGFGNVASKRLYAVFKGLSILYSVIPIDQARKILATLPTFPSIPLTQAQQENLIAQLLDEGIVEPVYFTQWGIPLIGRRNDIAAILKLLDEGKCFLILVGVPGVGKTELARQIEVIYRRQNKQVQFLPLDLERDANAIIEKINFSLHDKGTYGKPTLLILDNCERIVDEEISKLMRELGKLIETYTQLTFLLTSRITFDDINSENCYRVLPLAVPVSRDEPAGILTHYDAVRLFLDRGNIAEQHFTKYAKQIAAISIALDGIPLAINIVASWVEQLGIVSIYNGLVYNQPITNDQTSVQKIEYSSSEHKAITLDKVIGWSYARLDEEERMLFRWLSVFPRKCRLDSVNVICMQGNFPTTKDKPINIVKKLHNHSLLHFADQHVDMHNTVRTYGRRKMDNNTKFKIKHAPLFLLLSDPHGTMKLRVQPLPTEEEIVVEEALYLRDLFMQITKANAFLWFINVIYNREKLEEMAALPHHHFLDTPTEDIDTLIEQLRSVLFDYRWHQLDIFRIGEPLDDKYPPFIDVVIQVYKARLTEPLVGKEARKLFFDIFDEIYPEMLFGMLIEEIAPYLEWLKKISQDSPWNGQMWPLFDLLMGDYMY